MFPSDMVPSATGKAAKEDSAKPPPPQHSCLDGLWAVLREAGQLYEQQPRPVAAALSVLCALWQNSDRANRIVDALRTQPGFWKAIAACVPDTDASAQSDSDWEEGDSDALLTWKLLAQSKALEVITLELHANPESMASDAAEGTWQALAQWRSGRDRASAVVEHCCQMCPRMDLLADTRRAARAAAVELLAHVYSLPTGSCWTGPPLLERLRLENMWMEGLLFNGAVTPDSLFQLSSDMLSREPEGGFPAQRQRLLNESHSWPDSLEELLLTAAAVPRRSANAADAEAEALIHADASGGWWGPNPSTDGATAAALAATAFNVAALEAALGPGLVRGGDAARGGGDHARHCGALHPPIRQGAGDGELPRSPEDHARGARSRGRPWRRHTPHLRPRRGGLHLPASGLPGRAAGPVGERRPRLARSGGRRRGGRRRTLAG